MHPYQRLAALCFVLVAVTACGDVPAAPSPSSEAAVASAPAASSSSVEPSVAAPTLVPAPSSVEPSAAAEPSAATSPEASAAASVAADAPEIAVVLPDNTVELVQGTERRAIAAPGETTTCGQIGWSPDGYRLALADGIYTLVDEGGEAVHAPIMGAYFSWNSDGSRVAWLAGVDEHLDVIRVGGPDGAEQEIVGGAHWGSTGRIAWGPNDETVLSGPLEAAADGSGFQIVETHGRNPVWSPDGSQLAWSSASGIGADASISVMVGDGTASNATTAGTIAIPLPPDNGIPPEVERATLRWLPDGSGLVLALSRVAVGEAGGTYLVRDGTVTRISADEMCDLSPDGTQMVAWTGDNTIVIANVADGSIVAELGNGVAAAWRPQPSGSAPDASLAEQSPTLAAGTADASADAVRELQQRLNEQGFDAGAVDGIFGPQTEAAVRAFQEAQELEADGVVGPRTWAALRFDPINATKEFFQQ